MEWYVWIALAILGVLAIALYENQISFAIFMVIVGGVVLVIWFFMNRPKTYPKAIELLRQRIMQRAVQIGNPLGYLYLSGGQDAQRLYAKIILGKIRGWTKLQMPVDKGKPNEFYIFRYTPRGIGLIAGIVHFIVNLPVLNMFLGIKDNLFLISSAELGNNSLTYGDIILLGTNTETVSIFETLNTPHLDKDLLMGELKLEVARITLEETLNNFPEIVGSAIFGDSSHSKVMEAIHGKPEDLGIKRDV